jgi:hypothetical protein
MNREELINEMNMLREKLFNTSCTIDDVIEIQMDLTRMGNELMCIDKPELRNRVCGMCKGLYNGYGNNSYPLNIGDVCDSCNAEVISFRMAVKQIVKS